MCEGRAAAGAEERGAPKARIAYQELDWLGLMFRDVVWKNLYKRFNGKLIFCRHIFGIEQRALISMD